MDRSSDKEQSVSPTPPKSDSNLSVQTIIQRYDQKQQQLQQQQLLQQQLQHTNQSNGIKNSFNKTPPPSSSPLIDTNADNHLYNTPDFNNKKDQVEVFSTEPIIVHTTPTTTGNNNASASSSITLITSPPDEVNRFPVTIWLGVIQLLLSVTLTALGGLMLARNASLAHTGSGLWAGGICGIAGALGVINVRKAQTGFLAISLICVASSTLALALTGIGLVRDINLVSFF